MHPIQAREHVKGSPNRGMWSKKEYLNYINHLELLAAFLALQSFAKWKYNITIQLKIDNLMVVTYINKMEELTHKPCAIFICYCATGVCSRKYTCLQSTVADQESRVMWN